MIETSESTTAIPGEGPPAGDGCPVAAAGAERPRRKLRIALAHDWLCGYRGGEAVLERLARMVASEHEIAGLYVMFDDGRSLSAAVDGLRIDSGARIVSSWLNRLPGGSTKLRRWLLPLYPSAVTDLSKRLAAEHARRPIDLVVSTSSAAVKGLKAPAGVQHLCYCHAPARYVWSRGSDYAGGLRGIGLRAFGESFRRWDARTSSNVTRFVANSTHTAREVQRCYGREAHVVHPPVRTEFYTPGSGRERQNFWLVVSALEPYKRVDLAIEAAELAGAELVIAGAGSQRGRLEKLAKSSRARVRFAGRISDAELRELYREAKLLLFPQVEDFGIVAAEALACGLPVVARREGGAMDIIEDGVTGALVDRATAQAFVEGAKRAPAADAAACREKAMRFSEAAFDRAMREQIREVIGGASGSQSTDDIVSPAAATNA